MKSVFFYVLVLVTYSSYAQELSLPENPKQGHCYVKCLKGQGLTDRNVVWKDIHCALVNFQPIDIGFMDDTVLSKKDKKTIDRIFKKIIKEGYHVQLDSYFFSKNSFEHCLSQSRERVVAVANYIVAKGMDPDRLRVFAKGKKEAMGTAIYYRLINAKSE